MYMPTGESRGERRKESRFAADLRGVLNWDGISQSVIIRNISAYGALIHGAYLPTVGTEVVLIADHLEVCAEVIWRSEERCGLLLTHEVDPYVLLSGHPIATVGEGPPPLITLYPVAPGAFA
ncbi:MAG: PilZ domain-containing protein [Sphingobium sp.]